MYVYGFCALSYTQTVLILYAAINPTYMLVVQKALTNMTVCAGIFLTMN